MKAPFWKPALIYGAILGFVGILFSLIFYFMDLAVARWTQWVQIAISVAVLAYLLVAYRNEYLGGYASYGQIFLMGLVVGIIASIISAAYSYLLFAVIDPGLIDQIKLMAEERIMSNPRIPESMYDDIMDRMDNRMTPMRMTIQALIWGSVINAIFTLVIAAFVKKEQTPSGAAV